MYSAPMGIFDSIMKYFSSEQQAIYCQNCGKELTSVGGDVSDSGRIYCTVDDQSDGCGLKALYNGIEEMKQGLILNFYEPSQVQKAIRRKELIQFGPLERKVEE